MKENKLTDIMINQFLKDLNIDHDSGTHLFSTSDITSDMRYWAQQEATIIISHNRLFVRTNNLELTQILQQKYQDCAAQWFTEMSNLKELENILNSYGLTIGNIAPFFVADKSVTDIDEDYIMIEKDMIEAFKESDFKESFTFDKKFEDVLGIALEKNQEIVCVSGLNRTGLYTYEIGVHVKENYNHQGFGTKAVQALIYQAQKRWPDALITYGTQWSHTNSLNLAINVDLKLGWTEIMIKRQSVVE